MQGYEDGCGNMIVPFGGNICYEPFQTLGFVLKRGGIVAINLSGKELFKVFMYDNFPDELSDGLFRMYGKDGKIGFADSTGHIVIQPRFEFVTPFKQGYAFFNVGGKEVPVGNNI